MGQEEGVVRLDPLFVGLTRPTLFFGVSMMFGMLNVFVCIVYFIQTSDFKVVILALLIHLAGYIACFKEPLIIELIVAEKKNCNICANKIYHGANSYDTY